MEAVADFGHTLTKTSSSALFALLKGLITTEHIGNAHALVRDGVLVTDALWPMSEVLSTVTNLTKTLAYIHNVVEDGSVVHGSELVQPVQHAVQLLQAFEEPTWGELEKVTTKHGVAWVLPVTALRARWKHFRTSLPNLKQ